MLDNLALLFVHGSLGILFWRLIKRVDPDDVPPVRTKATERFRRPDRLG